MCIPCMCVCMYVYPLYVWAWQASVTDRLWDCTWKNLPIHCIPFMWVQCGCVFARVLCIWPNVVWQNCWHGQGMLYRNGATAGFHWHLSWGTEGIKVTWVYPSRNWGCNWALEETSKVITICVLCCLCMANAGLSLYFSCVCSNPWTAIYRNTGTLHRKRQVAGETPDGCLIYIWPVEIKLIKHWSPLFWCKHKVWHSCHALLSWNPSIFYPIQSDVNCTSKMLY